MAPKSEIVSARVALPEGKGKYSFITVYQRSWKMVAILLLAMLIFFPAMGFVINGKVGWRGALIGMFISINFQILAFLFQYLTIRDLRKSMYLGLAGFGIKILLLIGALMLVSEHFPQERNTAIIMLLVSIFITATVQAKMLGSARMLTVEPKMPWE